MKLLKNLLMIVACILILCYIVFLAGGSMLAESQFSKAEFKKAVFEKTKMNINYKKIRILTTPTLQYKIKASDVKIDYSDDKPFASIGSVNFDLSAINLLFKNIKLSNIDLKNANVDLIVLENGKTKIDDYLTEQVTAYPCKYSFTLSTIKLDDYKFSKQNVQAHTISKEEGAAYTIAKTNAVEYLNTKFKDVKIK